RDEAADEVALLHVRPGVEPDVAGVERVDVVEPEVIALLADEPRDASHELGLAAAGAPEHADYGPRRHPRELAQERLRELVHPDDVFARCLGALVGRVTVG